MMHVYSGKCRLCDVGIALPYNDYNDKQLHTGDIIWLFHGEYLGTDIEQWIPIDNLTVVVANQYQSYSDGSIKELCAPFEIKPFVMGIANCGFDADDWQIRIVKKYSDVVDGEHWSAYGFSYKVLDDN